LLLTACATTGPHVTASEVAGFERILRAKSVRFFIEQDVRVQVVGTRLLQALPESDHGERTLHLGVVAEDATDTLADVFGVPRRDGVLIVGVLPGGPGERAGLAAGDYLERVGDISIRRTQDLAAIGGLEPVGPVAVVVRRGDALADVSVVPASLPLNVAFRVVEDDAVSAFTTPWTITITTGMLRFVRGDDELAVVVGRELARITRGHFVGRVMLALPAVAVGAVAAVAPPGSQRLVVDLVGRAVTKLVRGVLTLFDRGFEREADTVGTVYTYLAGYDPRASSAVWERFAVELPSSITTTMFAEYPPSTERLLRLQKVADALLLGVPAGQVLAGAISAGEAAPNGAIEPVVTAGSGDGGWQMDLKLTTAALVEVNSP
jgi:hypothetical protein